MKKIIVKIKKGKVKIEAEGYTGTSCQDATKQIEEALGVVDDRDLKDEYYQEDENEQVDQF